MLQLNVLHLSVFLSFYHRFFLPPIILCHDLFFWCFNHNKTYDRTGCSPQLEFIQTDRVILSCVHLQNGPCDESCVTAHPFADSPLVTHQLSHFLSAGLWSPRLKLKISRYNPFLAAVGSSFCILQFNSTHRLCCTQ